jgi:hypothetical protein
LSDEVHPTVQKLIEELLDEITAIGQARDQLDQRWADAHLNLRQLVGSDARVGKLLGFSAAAGRQRMIKARRLRSENGTKSKPIVET